MDNDATGTPGTSSQDEGSSATGTPNEAGTGQDELSLARKRQAGAEAARQVAEAKAKELEIKLAKYEQETQTAAQKELTELARWQAQAESEKRRADEAEKKAIANYLDKVYPDARKELPEVTDEVRLAKFQAMLAEQEPPTPLQHSERNTASNAGAGKTAEPKTAAEAIAALEKMPMPVGWPTGR